MRRSITTSHSASFASMSSAPKPHSWVLLVPNWSCTSGEPSSSAFSGSTTAGSESYSTTTCSAASITPYLSSPTTTATGSPTCTTLPRASGQCSGVFTSTPGGTQAIGMPEPRSDMSSPVNTACTPCRASAPDLSIEAILACASVERTKAAWSMPGTTMSSTYTALPWIRRGSSLRFIAWPT